MGCSLMGRSTDCGASGQGLGGSCFLGLLGGWGEVVCVCVCVRTLFKCRSSTAEEELG